MASNSAETLQEAFNWVSMAGHEATEFTKFVTKYYLMHMLGTAAGTALGGAAAAWSIHRGVFKEKTINVGQTLYTPTGEINPRTGREFVRQQLITVHDNFTFQGAYHGPWGRSLARKLTKAAELTEIGDVFVLDRLKDVVGQKNLEKVTNLTASHWRGHFGTRLNAGLGPLEQEEYANSGLKFNPWFAIPAVEKSHDDKAVKVLYIPLSFLKEGALPHPDDMLVEVEVDENGQSRFEYAPDHPDACRLTTNQKIVDRINQDPEYWRKNWLIKEIVAPKAKVISAAPVGPAHPH